VRLYLNLIAKAQGDMFCPLPGASNTHFYVNDFLSETNKAGAQYVAYLFAHDPSEDGMIQCGEYVGNYSS